MPEICNCSRCQMRREIINELKGNGMQGERGFPGLSGANGKNGEKGEKGEQGIQGIQGEKGEQGVQGEKGERGSRGPKGAGLLTCRFFSDDKKYTFSDKEILPPNAGFMLPMDMNLLSLIAEISSENEENSPYIKIYHAKFMSDEFLELGKIKPEIVKTSEKTFRAELKQNKGGFLVNKGDKIVIIHESTNDLFINGVLCFQTIDKT